MLLDQRKNQGLHSLEYMESKVTAFGDNPLAQLLREDVDLVEVPQQYSKHMSSSIFDMNESGLFPKGVGEPVAGTGILYDFQKNNSLVKDQFATTVPLVEEIRKMTIPQKSGQVKKDLRMDSIFLPTIFEKLSKYKENIGKGIVQERNDLFTEPEKLYLETLPKDKSDLQQLITRAQKSGLDLGESFSESFYRSGVEEIESKKTTSMPDMETGSSKEQHKKDLIDSYNKGEAPPPYSGKTQTDVDKLIEDIKTKGLDWENEFNMEDDDQTVGSVMDYKVLSVSFVKQEMKDTGKTKDKVLSPIFKVLKEHGKIDSRTQMGSSDKRDKVFTIIDVEGNTSNNNWNGTKNWFLSSTSEQRYFVPGMKTAFALERGEEKKLSESGFAEEKEEEREQLQEQRKKTKKKVPKKSQAQYESEAF
jgi:hypothetical protein